jgi:hypothetical protein
MLSSSAQAAHDTSQVGNPRSGGAADHKAARLICGSVSEDVRQPRSTARIERPIWPAASPVDCPPWCDGPHGHQQSLFHDRITAEEVIFHGVDLSKVGRVSIDLWSSQPHPATGEAPESGVGLFLDGERVEDVAGLDVMEALESDLSTGVRQARQRYAGLTENQHCRAPGMSFPGALCTLTLVPLNSRPIAVVMIGVAWELLWSLAGGTSAPRWVVLEINSRAHAVKGLGFGVWNKQRNRPTHGSPASV